MIITYMQKTKMGYPLTLIVNHKDKTYQCGYCIAHHKDLEVSKKKINEIRKELELNGYKEI